MSHAMVSFWLISVMIVSLVALALAMMFIYSTHWRTHDKIFRIGFILTCLGLGVQTFRSIHFLQFGYYPIDYYFPTWIVKDVGISMMIYSKFQEFRRAA